MALAEIKLLFPANESSTLRAGEVKRPAPSRITISTMQGKTVSQHRIPV